MAYELGSKINLCMYIFITFGVELILHVLAPGRSFENPQPADFRRTTWSP